MRKKELKVVAIYDNGGETLDRYTVAVNNRSRFTTKHPWEYECICASENGLGVFMWGTCVRGKHLGKLVPLSALSPELQQRINHELKL